MTDDHQPEHTPAPETPRPRRRGLLPVIVVAALLGAGWLVWTIIDPTPKNFGVVEDGAVYRSGELHEADLRWLADNRELRTVIDLGAYDPGSDLEQRMRDVAAEVGVNRIEFRMHGDAKGNPEDYARVVALLADEANHPVVVHCAAGAQRTGMAVLLYRSIVQGEPVGEAYKETLGYGHAPDDNDRFLTWLVDNIDEVRAAYREITEAPAAPAPVDGG